VIRREAQNSSSGRIQFVVAIFTLLFFIATLRLFYLQTSKHEYLSKQAVAQRSYKDVIPSKRGQIFAADTLTNNPFLIATNQTLDLLYLDGREVENGDEVALKISAVVAGISKDEILSKINKESSYIPLKHKLTHEESKKVKELDLRGVGLISENWRYYPEQKLASSVLGFVNNEGAGNYGIEESFNDELTGEDGLLKEEIDNKGIRITFGNNISKPATNGDDVYLTIDRYIQGMAEKTLGETVKKFSAEGGTVIVMDTKTGKILALANAPFYNPNDFAAEKDYNVFKNKAVSDLYEPGSVFKVITVAAGLDAGKIEPDTKYEDTGLIELDGHKIQNSDKKAHGVCDMTYVLEQSLNTGTTWIQQKLGKDLFYDYLKRFGFGDLTGIEFLGEAQGLVYKPKDLNDHGYATMSFGQSISTTPLQMANSYASIANGGKLMRPYVVEKIVGKDGKEKITEPKEIRSVMSQSASDKLKNMMVSVTEKGHGQQSKVAGYKIAGKTGTAQVVKPEGGYDPNKNIGTFIGFPVAPGADFVVLAKVDSPKGLAWAESSAAPIVGQMLDFLLKYYQIPTTEKI
jgi:cell division protein FtsI/penicillin-binding protein 2